MSLTPFHAVHNAIVQLEKIGFQKVLEKDILEESLQPGGKDFSLIFPRNTALVAFTLPQKWKQGVGVSIVATHVDSPNLKVRLVSKHTEEGYLQVGVVESGWHSWLDRDLSLARRVVTTHADGFKSKLVKVDQPVLRIPTLTVH
ncbi:peptidase M18 [Mycena galopus ATCC 62051]|nr:peptidase M18 [Mycena galopus ATCC 62051]